MIGTNSCNLAGPSRRRVTDYTASCGGLQASSAAGVPRLTTFTCSPWYEYRGLGAERGAFTHAL